MGSIKLSPKHGVNPSIATCFWCGEATNSLVLFGRLPNDQEAGMYCGALDYEPCDKCKENWSQGILLIEAGMSPQSENQPEMQKGVYPTGRYLVLKPEAVNRIFTPDAAAEILKHRKCFMDFETFGQFVPVPEPR
jgi:hypothetical protein